MACVKYANIFYDEYSTIEFAKFAFKTIAVYKYMYVYVFCEKSKPGKVLKAKNLIII